MAPRPKRQVADQAAAFLNREQVDIDGQWSAAARLRLHLESLSPSRIGRCEALRRDASAYPDIRQLGRRQRCRITGQPSRAEVWQITLRADARRKGIIRSFDDQILVQLSDQAFVSVWDGRIGLP